MKNEALKYLPFAQRYLDFGWSLLPMQFITDESGKTKKQPMIPWKEYQSRQPTIEEVTSWLEKGWFLGIITGKQSGIAIVDDDRIKHNLPPAILNSTIIAKTKSGGTHYYFKYDRLITNHANSDFFVDIRGEGGYCVIPPFNGYEWIKRPTGENRQNLPILDPDLEKQIIGDKAQRQGEIIKLTDFENVWDGERNQTMYQLACSTWNNYQLTESEKILQIQWLNETRCRDKDGNSHPLTAQELQTLINSAKSFVENNPKDKIAERIADKSPVPTPKSLDTVIGDRRKEIELEKICAKTGLYSLDQMVKGFMPGHLYTMTGDTNVGKTSLACNFAVDVAKQGKKVLYLALEPDNTVVDYIASVYNRKPFDQLTDSDYNFQNLKIDIFGKNQITSPEHLVKTIQTLERYDLVIIDHIGYFVKDKNNTNQEQSNVIKMLAGLARDKKTAIMMIAHLRKADIHTKKARLPTMDDISGSASFKQDSTDVWIVFKKRDMDDETGVKYLNEGFLMVGKSKSGGNGVVRLTFADKSALIYEQMDFPTELESKQIESNLNDKFIQSLPKI